MKYFLMALAFVSIYGCGNKENPESLSPKKADSLRTVYKSVSEDKREQIVSLEQGSFFFPHFSPNDSKIYATSNSQKGIYSIDISSREINTITGDQGAGYNFIVMQKGSILVYRRDSFSSRRRKSEIVLTNIAGDSSKIIFNEAIDLSYPIKVNENVFAFTAGGQLKIYDITQSAYAEPSNVKDTILYVDGDSYSLLANGQKKPFAPFGKGSYVWASLSPNKNAVVFNYMGKGTFVADLEGKEIARLAYAGYPQWSPDGNWIAYMTEESDGHVITRAEIFITSSDGKITFQITSSDNLTELYPSWSHDGGSLVYNSDKGEVYISKLSFNK